jgi:N-acetylmuramoyl-L-alanine amidase
MSKLIVLDDGHGMQTAGKRTPPIPELGGRVIRENEFNREVVKYLDIELKRCGFRTLFVAPTDADTSLSARTNLANSNKADAYISIHYNAFDGKFDAYDPEGLSVHIYPGSKEGRKLAECILKYLKEGTPQKNRGIVENNFHVLRETKMVAILSENGFMDNKREALLMLNIDFQKEVAREHAQGICDYFGVKYIKPVESSKPSTNILYRVQTGAFKNKVNADRLLSDVKAAGFETYMIQENELYKVQVGAYSIKKNAENIATKLKEKGFNVYITTK